MQNIKKKIIDRLIQLKPTAATIDVLFYLSKYQSISGEIKGIYYKDVCDHVKITPPTFYTAKKWLEENLFISSFKNEWLYDITILDNDFTDYQELLNREDGDEWRYLSIAKEIFSDQAFLTLKANEKLFIIQLMLDFHNKEYKIKTLYEKYTQLFQVGRRAICNYLCCLKRRFKKYFSIYLKCGKYYIKLNALFKTAASDRLQTDAYRFNLIRGIIFKQRIKPVKNNIIDNIADFLLMYKNKVEDRYLGSSGVDLLLTFIDECIQQQIERDNKNNPLKRTWVRQINPSHIHAMLREKMIQKGVFL